MCRQFRAFLRNLPPDAVLVMNGDTVDVEGRPMQEEHREALADICAESFRRRIVWTWGNHGGNWVPREPNRIESVASWSDGMNFFAHGERFMPAYGLYRAFNRIVETYRKCGVRDSLSTIKLAKSLPLLFGILKRASIANAVRFAEKNGHRTIVCGHLHTVVDTTIRGIRYVNTGAWTDWPAYYLLCGDGEMRLIRADE